MGTNFYISGHRGDDTPEWHIGKRWAAGIYCHFCNTSLVPFLDAMKGNYTCPRCGATKPEKVYHAAEVELGFQWAKGQEYDIGVGSISGFS